MAHRNVGFLEARKIFENGHNPAGRILHSLQVLKISEGMLNLNMLNFPPLKMTIRQKEWGNTETSESNEAPSQQIGWSPG
jgi:hypothetical protein